MGAEKHDVASTKPGCFQVIIVATCDFCSSDYDFIFFLSVVAMRLETFQIRVVRLFE